MISFPKAKINLGLSVVEKRPDGFHNIESVMIPIEWCDVLEIIKGDTDQELKVEFSSSGIEVPRDTNLCIQAYNLLSDLFTLPPIKMHLHKAIPIGAGLGGGSSDAASTLKLLNQLFSLELEDERLEKFASQLGSDCAFFVNEKPAYVYGRGDEYQPIDLGLTGKYVLVAYPGIHVSTAEAYANLTPITPKRKVRDIVGSGLENWQEHLTNSFEKNIAANHPLIAEIKEEMYTSGAIYSSMTGSGSAVYGIFDSTPEVPASFSSYKLWKGKLYTP